MNNFWSKRLGNSTGPAPSPYPPAAPAPSYQSGPAYPQPQPTTSAKAPSSLSTTTCPQCGSGNYTGSPGNPSDMKRCYDCGFNPRFGQQSGAGGMPAGQSAPASRARQVSTTSNYQPQVIIGRIG